MNSIELLAPAGDFECLKSAIFYGADAVYVGGVMFGMRASAAKFNFDLLEKAVKLAHLHKVKLYLTCNTIPSNDEINKLKSFLQTAQELKVDGLIVADLGVFMEAKKTAPKIPIHISTQFGVMNFKTANALYQLGAKRIVLARELSIENVKIIRNNTPIDLELESFVHGAMCVSFSGRCLISQYLLNRDANRGNCAQPCRWSYSLVETSRPNEFFPVFENDVGTYILNSKDLCLINRIAELKEAGVYSFKIEGRAKSAYYVGIITNAYRMAIDFFLNKEPLEKWVIDEVDAVSHRPYFEGFLFQDPLNKKITSQHYSFSSYIKTYDVIAVVEKFEKGLFLCLQKNKFQIQDHLEIIIPKHRPIKLKIEQMFDEGMNKIDSAPHAHMKVYLKFDYDLLDKVNNDFNFSGCFLRRLII